MTTPMPDVHEYERAPVNGVTAALATSVGATFMSIIVQAMVTTG
jgi:hypothetical protein